MENIDSIGKINHRVTYQEYIDTYRTFIKLLEDHADDERLLVIGVTIDINDCELELLDHAKLVKIESPPMEEKIQGLQDTCFINKIFLTGLGFSSVYILLKTIEKRLEIKKKQAEKIKTDHIECKFLP